MDSGFDYMTQYVKEPLYNFPLSRITMVSFVLPRQTFMCKCLVYAITESIPSPRVIRDLSGLPTEDRGTDNGSKIQSSRPRKYPPLVYEWLATMMGKG